jgi:hypothetical protein
VCSQTNEKTANPVQGLSDSETVYPWELSSRYQLNGGEHVGPRGVLDDVKHIKFFPLSKTELAS